MIFVTHDIDEAIKLGDRIAILREGGVLAQYDTPEEILAHPADDFVARFVGADRGLKRLALRRLSEIELDPPNGTLDGLPHRDRDDASRRAVADARRRRRAARRGRRGRTGGAALRQPCRAICSRSR